jgi:hypothetical protein
MTMLVFVRTIDRRDRYRVAFFLFGNYLLARFNVLVAQCGVNVQRMTGCDLLEVRFARERALRRSRPSTTKGGVDT